jgi:two-component system sensor histidine kinase KdpD
MDNGLPAVTVASRMAAQRRIGGPAGEAGGAWLRRRPAAARQSARPWRPRARAATSAQWSQYLCGLAGSALCTAITFPVGTHVDLINIVMVYMLGSAAAGFWLGRWPSALTAVANVLAFDFFFVPPRFSLAVYEVSYLITFSAMLLVSLLITSLVIAVREQTEAAGARSMAEITVRRIAEGLHCCAFVLLCDEHGRVAAVPVASSGGRLAVDRVAAHWVASRGERAGSGTQHRRNCAVRAARWGGCHRKVAAANWHL